MAQAKDQATLEIGGREPVVTPRRAGRRRRITPPPAIATAKPSGRTRLRPKAAQPRQGVL